MFFTDDTSLVYHHNHIYINKPVYKTKEFIQKHKYALIKIITTYHRKFLHEHSSLLVVADSIKLRTNQYLENSCDLVAWFLYEYYNEEPGTEEVSYISIGDLHVKTAIQKYSEALQKFEEVQKEYNNNLQELKTLNSQ